MKPKSVRVYRVPINQGGYDRDGEYWGVDMPLYCATGGEYLEYVRAYNRDDAIEKLDIPIERLIVKPRKD